MSSVALCNFQMNDLPLLVLTTFVVVNSNSLVSAFKWAVLPRLGTWQCWEKILQIPRLDTLAFQVCNINCNGNDLSIGPTTRHGFHMMPTIHALPGLHKWLLCTPVVLGDNGPNYWAHWGPRMLRCQGWSWTPATSLACLALAVPTCPTVVGGNRNQLWQGLQWKHP